MGRRVERKQVEQKQRHDCYDNERLFKPGDLVYARNYAWGEKWVPGRIDERMGPVSFAVELENHRMTRRHKIRYLVEKRTTEKSITIIQEKTG